MITNDEKTVASKQKERRLAQRGKLSGKPAPLAKPSLRDVVRQEMSADSSTFIRQVNLPEGE